MVGFSHLLVCAHPKLFIEMPFLKFSPYHFSHSSFTIFLTQVTALHLAAWFDKSGSGVRALIEAGASINAFDSYQNSPLHLAAIWNPAAVPVLLAGNAKVNILNRGNSSPLFFAACWNHPECVVDLCKAGADPHLGKSPLTDSETEMRDLIKSLSN